MLAYVFPVILVIATFFFASNRGNRIATIKLTAMIVLTCFICMFIELVLNGAAAPGPLAVYEYCYANKVGGGIIGGLLAWLIALVRLLVPFSLPSVLSLYSRVEQEIFILTPTPDTVLSSLLPLSPRMKAIGTSAFPSIWLILYLAGTLLCAAWFAISYVRCRREFSASLPVESAWIRSWVSERRLLRPLSVRESDRIGAPLTYGIFRPVILLPKHTDLNDRQSVTFILEHECAHIRRFDALWKILLTAAVCVHWFNPLVWLMLFLANRDIELACDESVIRHCGAASAPYYAKTLLSMEEKRAFPHPLCSSFSKNALKARITALMKNRGISRLTAAVGVIALICLFFVFGTSSLQIGGDANHVERIIGESEIFTEAEINDMMDTVIRFFPAFEGCTLRELNYDEEVSLREPYVQNAPTGRRAVLLSTFDTSETSASGGFNPDFTYRRWMWLLEKNSLGGWTIYDWGY